MIAIYGTHTIHILVLLEDFTVVVHGTCLATVIEAQSCNVSKFEDMNLVLDESTTWYIVTSNFLDVSNIPTSHEYFSVNFLQHDKTCRQIYHAWMLCKPFVPITNGSTLDEKWLSSFCHLLFSHLFFNHCRCFCVMRTQENKHTSHVWVSAEA